MNDIVSESNETHFSNETSVSLEKEQDNQNDLREFGVDANEPDLFSSENANLDTNEFLNSTEDEKDEGENYLWA